MSEQNPETSTAEPDYSPLTDWVTEKLGKLIDLVRAGDMEAAHRHALAVELVLPLLRDAGMDAAGTGSAALRALRRE